MSSTPIENDTQPQPDSITTKVKEDLERQIDAILQPYTQRHSENIHRITELLRLYMRLKANPESSSLPAINDILRAAVVFAHATLEDFLRTIGARLLPYANEPGLNEIPLKGQNPMRPVKFFLGTLAQFKGQSIDAVIAQSVDAYLQHTNFNNTGDIAAHLEKLGVDPSAVNRSFTKLDQLLERRHLIVHQADRLDIPLPPQLRTDMPLLREIDVNVVIDWLEALNAFFAEVVTEVTKLQMNFQTQITTTQQRDELDQSTD